MYSSLSVPKQLSILAVLAVQLIMIRGVLSLNMTNAYLHHKCFVSQGRYKAGSAYEKNLKYIIQSITSTGNFRGGYEMMSLREDLAFVSFNLQCRGDSYGPKCRSCYATALPALRRRCPRYKGGIIWYDQCLVQISGINSEGKIDYDNNFCMSNAKNVDRGEDSLDRNANILIDNLTSIAISVKNYSDPAALYAAGERRIGSTKKLYGMVQCTKDISPKACQECVVYNILRFQDCLFSKRGARVLGRSCNFRFELYPFIYTKTGHKYLKV